MRLGLAYNEKPTTGHFHRDADHPHIAPSAVDAFAEWDAPETIAAVERAISVFGDVVRLEAIDDFASRLADARVDLLFNMAEGLSGPSREAHVPAIAEFLGIPYTASDPMTLAIALHKARAKEVFLARGIPTAPFLLLEADAHDRQLRDALHYPLFLKPVWEGSSKGIAESSIVEDADAAIARSRELRETYRQPVLAEEFLEGDEFTVAVLGNGEAATALPVIRYRFNGLPSGARPIMGYEAKWIWDERAAELDILECPAAVPERVAGAVRDVALAAYRALDCRDWGRVDVRLDRDGTPCVIEVNPLPGIMPDPLDNSCFPRAAAAQGMTYDELIQSVVRCAWLRLTGEALPHRMRSDEVA